MTDEEYPKLLFSEPFDERAQFESAARGYLSTALVQLKEGTTYSVLFYDCTRLAQDLEYEVSAGRMCVAEPGMIVLPEVTLENMNIAIRKLVAEGYFDHLRPITGAPASVPPSKKQP
jgi:hypothetical protein